jgi:hypothetical protein
MTPAPLRVGGRTRRRRSLASTSLSRRRSPYSILSSSSRRPGGIPVIMWWLYRAGLGGSTVFVRKRALNIAALTSATMRTTFVASLLALATRTTGLSSTPTGRRLSWDELSTGCLQRLRLTLQSSQKRCWTWIEVCPGPHDLKWRATGLEPHRQEAPALRPLMRVRSASGRRFGVAVPVRITPRLTWSPIRERHWHRASNGRSGAAPLPEITGRLGCRTRDWDVRSRRSVTQPCVVCAGRSGRACR